MEPDDDDYSWGSNQRNKAQYIKMEMMKEYKKDMASYGNRDMLADLLGTTANANVRVEPEKKRDKVSEGNYYLVPTKISTNANKGVIKSFFKGQVNGQVVPMDLTDGYIVLAFQSEEDASMYKMSDWESDILEMLEY